METRNVVIQWADEPENNYATKVAIDPNWTEQADDDSVFFYFQNEAELEQAKIPNNGFEFVIVEEYK